MEYNRRVWWEEITLCKGKTKTGERCRNPARRPYEVNGRLIIPLTCWRHADQEEEIRKKLVHSGR